MHVAYVLQSLPLKGPWPQPGRQLNVGGQFLELYDGNAASQPTHVQPQATSDQQSPPICKHRLLGNGSKADGDHDDCEEYGFRRYGAGISDSEMD